MISGEYDLIYAGGTLSLLHAGVMAGKYGRKVMIFDRQTPAKSTRDWNISRKELLNLSAIGLFHTTFWLQSARPSDRVCSVS